jgi:methionyl-tRNA formyltransferase
LRVGFAGTPEFALPALEALHAHHEIVGVLTRPDRPSGRGRKLTATPVKRAALAYGLPLAQPASLKGDVARMQLESWRPEVVVVVAYGLMVPPELLRAPAVGWLNIHASLLPRWRGAAPIERAILAGDRSTGVTIMQLDAGLDTGPILLQREIEIRPDHTGGLLRTELAALGAEALLETLTGLSGGGMKARSQSAEGATYAPRIEKSEARIDWTQDAARIERQVRAFNPEPVAETRLGGEQLRIFRASAWDATGAETMSKSADPGTIVEVTGDKMIVRCGRGSLAVMEVQRPGRRPVSVRDLSHSLPLAGRRLG